MKFATLSEDNQPDRAGGKKIAHHPNDHSSTGFGKTVMWVTFDRLVRC